MPRADFYLIEKPRFRDDPMLLVCELVKRAYSAELPTLVLVRTLEDAELLDDKLWAFEEDSYIPHQIAGQDDDDVTPVLIVPPGARAPDRSLVINLRDDCASGEFESVKEVVPAETRERDGSRQRWAEYRRRGFDVRKFDM